ncbi:MAG: hypothetical protein BBJ57_04165 [Desulfobacterales bacterium PC51MH44]|nr:MAG: hypothetical protein BBJ57_04165 [Desulfobacterales bacterium PC51MH44]
MFSQNHSSANQNKGMDTVQMLQGHFKLSDSYIVVGAPIFILFEYRNTSQEAVLFSIGHGLSDGFRCTSEDAGFSIVRRGSDLGGLAPEIHLLSGQSGSQTILLNTYLQPHQAGSYIVDCKVDFDVSGEKSGSTQHVHFADSIKLDVHDDPAYASKVMAELRKDIRGANPAQGREAVSIVATLGTSEAQTVLIEALTAKELTVVEAAIDCVAQLESSEAELALAKFIETTTVRSLKKRAKEVLGRMQQQ